MLSSLIPKVTDFSDDQIAEAGAKFLGKSVESMRKLVFSPQGQMVLAQLRAKLDEEQEQPGIMHRCPSCGFAHEIFEIKSS